MRPLCRGATVRTPKKGLLQNHGQPQRGCRTSGWCRTNTRRLHRQWRPAHSLFRTVFLHGGNDRWRTFTSGVHPHLRTSSRLTRTGKTAPRPHPLFQATLNGAAGIDSRMRHVFGRFCDPRTQRGKVELLAVATISLLTLRNFGYRRSNHGSRSGCENSCALRNWAFSQVRQAMRRTAPFLPQALLRGRFQFFVPVVEQQLMPVVQPNPG